MLFPTIEENTTSPPGFLERPSQVVADAVAPEPLPSVDPELEQLSGLGRRGGDLPADDGPGERGRLDALRDGVLPEPVLPPQARVDHVDQVAARRAASA